MGNQVSKTRKRKQSENNKSTSVTSARTFTDSFNGNTSVVSSSQPKFTSEVYPSTLIEANRQQGEHYLLKHLFQISYFAPVEDILSQPDSAALDIACGSHASWILDVANDFPNCTFYGFDIIEPFSVSDGDSIHVPENCKLKQLDLFEAGLDYPDNTFNFIHQRMMHLVYQQDKVPWVMSEILRVTKDDGWIEFIEPDITPKRAGPIFAKLTNGIRSFVKEKVGTIFDGSKLSGILRNAGLVDIKSDYGSLPVCWGGYVGKLVYEDMLQTLNHMGPLIYEYLDVEGEFNQEIYDELLDKACDECVEYQTFFNIRWACGRKPSKTTNQ